MHDSAEQHESQAHLPPRVGLSPSATRVAILANPTAGTGPGHALVQELIESLTSNGYLPVVCWRREELTDLLERSRDQLRCVVAAGGDGTLGEVLNRAPGVPVAVLPLGNENLAARHFGFVRSGRALADVIAAGHVEPLDLARANGRYFALMAGAGFDADVVRRVHAGRRGHINKLTYVCPIAAAAWSYSYPPIQVEIDDTGERLEGAMVFVFNLPRYALGLPLAPEARGDDSWLDLCVFQRPGRWNLVRYLWAVARRRQQRLPDFLCRRVKKVRLTSALPVPLQIDGDPAGLLPVTVEIAAAAGQMVLAERARDAAAIPPPP